MWLPITRIGGGMIMEVSLIKILLVEDNPDHVILTKAALKEIV